MSAKMSSSKTRGNESGCSGCPAALRARAKISSDVKKRVVLVVVDDDDDDDDDGVDVSKFGTKALVDVNEKAKARTADFQTVIFSKQGCANKSKGRRYLSVSKVERQGRQSNNTRK